MGSPGLKWKTDIPNMPLIDCLPYGRVAEINGILHVVWSNKMFWLEKGEWKNTNDLLPGIQRAWSVFECEEKEYVMSCRGHKCASIYEWKSDMRDVKPINEIPVQYQLDYRGAIGHNEKIYLAGGTGSDRVDCFDINKGEWGTIKKMKRKRDFCSLAVIDDKLFVGGGKGAGNSVECFSMAKQEWIDMNPTTEVSCQISSWNGKLVATGGNGKSNCVEMYDELSGDWLPLPSMNTGRVWHGTCSTKDNQLIVVEGWKTGHSVECLKLKM